jgi:caspase domain-containing protein
MIGARTTLVVAVAFALAASPANAAASTKVELLVIGNNQPYSSAANASLPVLRFADDDAAAFYDLMVGTGEAGHLLTVMDGDTQALYPKLAAFTRSPTIGNVRAAVADLGRRIEDNRRHGHRTVVYLFFSGHGTLRDDGGPALALLDGGITQKLLYDEILGKLPADYVHLFVDACHAEAIVRPRDVEAQSVRVARAEADAFLARSTLARFPHVGAVVAATTDAQAHEWDLLRQGVFTHELLSALRGAADVNHDARIEYSEIYAFIVSANRSVGDPNGRLSVVARPPALDRHIAVLERAGLPAATTAELRGVPAGMGLVQVEDAAGRRIASLRGERDYVADLILPAGGAIYVRAAGREARLDMSPGDVARFDALTFRDAGARSRGALEDAVRRGLFASEFGRGYYLGFIDQSPDFAPVSFAQEAVAREALPPPASRGREGPFVPGLVLVGGGLSNTVADTLELAPSARIQRHPSNGHGLALALDLAGARAPGIAEWRATLSGGWLWSIGRGPARGWLGVMAGGGMVAQTASGHADRRSGVITAGPSLGGALEVARRFGLWGEIQASGLAYLRDGAAAVTVLPLALVGVQLAL